MTDEKVEQGAERVETTASQQKIKDALNAYSDNNAPAGAEHEALSSSLDETTGELHAELEAAQNLAKENWDKYLRLQAEMQNLQRRAERDVANAHRYALDKFVDSLLPIVDSLEHALAAMNANSSTDLASFCEGIELTYKMFTDCLAKFNVKQLNPVGEVFNPELHEAISMQPSAEVSPNTILMVVQKGYDLHGRIVRPARVIVAKAP